MLTRKSIICLLLAVTLIGMSGSVYAQTKEGGKKLERGVIQLTTSIIDIPKAIYQESKATNPVVGIPIGFLKGLGNTFAHVLSGFFNIVTCPFPDPEMNAEMFPEQRTTTRSRGIK